MNEEIVCQAREQKRSLLGVNEHFAIRRLVQNLPFRTLLHKKIVNERGNFVPSKGAKAQFTWRK